MLGRRATVVGKGPRTDVVGISVLGATYRPSIVKVLDEEGSHFEIDNVKGE